MAAGARVARATSSTIRGTSLRQARLRKPPGRCLGSWPPARSTIPRSRRASTISWQGRGTDGFWEEQHFTATGFPRVFYLRYHGYAKFFPLWALARYRNLKSCQYHFSSGWNVSDEGAGFVIAATGLRAEARIAARSGGVRAVVGGGDGAPTGRARQAVSRRGRRSHNQLRHCRRACARNAPLGPASSAAKLSTAGLLYSADPAWTASIKKLIGSAELVRIAGIDRPLTRPSEKQALHQASGAAAADMESHVVARIAAELALPFAVLRVIADPAERALPPAALAGMRADGRIDVGAVLASLARSPGQLPALIRLADEAGRARAALLRCSDLLGPRLGFRDLS